MEMRAGEEDIEIGEDITPSVIPLSYALHDSFLHSHCSSCFSRLPSTNFTQHHHAPTLLYCSSICSSSHFSPAELNLLHSPPSSDLRAALRLLPHSLPSSSINRICGLLTNREKLMADEEISAHVRYGAKAIAAARRMEMVENEKNDAVLLEAALCVVLTNAVEVHDNEGRSIGIAVYGPNFSWINHSCSPNACYRFIISPDNVMPFSEESRLRILLAGTKSDNGVHNNIEFPKGCSGSGPRVIVRSIKRIKRGEEVTVAYTDLLQPKEIRRSELWGKYRFICCCTRCIASPPSYVDHVLQEISASNLASASLSSELSFYRDEATRTLTDYVDEVTAEYLAVGDPESCCKKLENMLVTGLLDEQLEVREGKSQLNFRLHPLHYLALNTYTILASAYKIRASDLFSLHSEVGGLSWEALSMSRISAAYSLLLATATYHLFCFESSLLASVANFWTSAGESLLALAKSSAWDSLGKCGFPVLNLSPLAKHKCSKCSLLESFEVNLSFGQDQIRKAGFDSVSSRFLDCIGSLLQEVWGFLIQGDRYLKMFKDPTDFRWLGKSLDIWDFDAELSHNDVDFNCWTNKSVSGIEALGYTDQWRINTFQLGVHCLLYGGFLAGMCYGPHSHWSSHIRSALNYEGK
uniref:SET domain-containing protein n=1 Tax=Populus davidiana TaxID=266767 RepID=A0A6M2F2J3_9ROSI